MPLTDIAIKKIAPRDKPYRLADGKGLALLFTQTEGSTGNCAIDSPARARASCWRWGVYPDVSLAEARARRDEARKLLTNDVDPSEHRKVARATKEEAAANSFQAVGLEWFANQKPKWSEVHATKTLWMLGSRWLGVLRN